MQDMMRLIMNNPEVIFSLGVVTSNIYAVFKNKIALHKISIYNGNIIKEHKRENNMTGQEQRKIVERNINLFDKKYLPYFKRILSNLSDSDLENICRNIIYLEIEANSSNAITDLLSTGTIGSYDNVANKIYHVGKHSITHEMLHMCSTYYDRKNHVSYSGFCQGGIYKGELLTIGRGLNEGYTEYLTSKIENNHLTISYINLAHLAKTIEFFFDDPKELEHLYFNGDLNGLIRCLEKYGERKEIIRMIIEMDQVLNYSVALSPLAPIKSAQIQAKLYNMYASKTNNIEQLDKMKKYVSKNPLAALLINKPKMKLTRNNPYEYKTLEEDNSIESSKSR